MKSAKHIRALHKPVGACKLGTSLSGSFTVIDHAIFPKTKTKPTDIRNNSIPLADEIKGQSLATSSGEHSTRNTAKVGAFGSEAQKTSNYFHPNEHGSTHKDTNINEQSERFADRVALPQSPAKRMSRSDTTSHRSYSTCRKVETKRVDVHPFVTVRWEVPVRLNTHRH